MPSTRHLVTVPLLLALTAAALLTVTPPAQAQAGARAKASIEVSTEFSAMDGSTFDTAMNMRMSDSLLAEGFERTSLQPTRASKPTQAQWLRIRFNYLYIPGTGTRVLSAVASVMDGQQREVCYVDSNTWSQGSSVNRVQDAVRSLPAQVLNLCLHMRS